MNDDPFEHIPKDLQDIGDALREHRDVADGHLLDRIQRRVIGSAPAGRSRRSFIPRRARTRAALILAVGFTLNVSGAMATVLTNCGISGSSASSLNITQIVSSIVNHTSTGNDYESAANHVYCPTYGTTYTSYGVMNGTGGKGDDHDCCPDKSSTSYNTTMNHTGGSTGDDHSCCPDKSSSTSYSTTMNHTGGSTGGSQECCPSSSSYSSYNTTMNHTGGSTGGSQQCCPSTSTAGFTTDTKTGTNTDMCCPKTSSSSSSTTCCPKSSDYSSSHDVCCPHQNATYGMVSNTNQYGGSKCCPNGTKVSMRWHYSVNGSSGSWSGEQTQGQGGAWSIGGSMEGNLKVFAGATLKAGYDVSTPSNNQSIWFTVTNPSITFTVSCVSGLRPSAGTISLTLPSQEYATSDAGWYPSGTQSSSLVYQGSTTVPNLCRGGQMSLSQGGSMGASFS